MPRRLPVVFVSAALLVVATLPGLAAGGGTLVATEGRVQARARATSQWKPAVLRQLYAPGDTLRTGRNARAEVAFVDGTVTRLAPHSMLRVAGSQSFGRLMLGRIWFKITRQHAPIRIETPSAVATVVGTELLVSVDTQDNTHLTCIDGLVKVRGDVGDDVQLKAGQWTDVRKGAPADPPTPFNWNRLKATEILLQPLKQDGGPETAADDPEDIWK